MKLPLVRDAFTCQRGAQPLHGLTMLTRKPLIRAGTRLLKSRSVAICRAIVEAHRGRIDVRDREGGGTVFAISLPVSAS